MKFVNLRQIQPHEARFWAVKAGLSLLGIVVYATLYFVIDDYMPHVSPSLEAKYQVDAQWE